MCSLMICLNSLVRTVRLHDPICLTDSFVILQGHHDAMLNQSTSLNRIVAYRVVLALI